MLQYIPRFFFSENIFNIDVQVRSKIKKHLTKVHFRVVSKYKRFFQLKNRFLAVNLRTLFLRISRKWGFRDFFFFKKLNIYKFKFFSYKLALMLKQLLKYFYMCNEKTFKRNILDKFINFSNRLDLVCIRVHFFKNILEARLGITRGFVHINGVAITYWNLYLKKHDFVTLHIPQEYSLQKARRYIMRLKRVFRYRWRIPVFLRSLHQVFSLINQIRLFICEVSFFCKFYFIVAGTRMRFFFFVFMRCFKVLKFWVRLLRLFIFSIPRAYILCLYYLRRFFKRKLINYIRIARERREKFLKKKFYAGIKKYRGKRGFKGLVYYHQDSIKENAAKLPYKYKRVDKGLRVTHYASFFSRFMLFFFLSCQFFCMRYRKKKFDILGKSFSFFFARIQYYKYLLLGVAFYVFLVVYNVIKFGACFIYFNYRSVVDSIFALRRLVCSIRRQGKFIRVVKKVGSKRVIRYKRNNKRVASAKTSKFLLFFGKCHKFHFLFCYLYFIRLFKIYFNLYLYFRFYATLCRRLRRYKLRYIFKKSTLFRRRRHFLRNPFIRHRYTRRRAMRRYSIRRRAMRRYSIRRRAMGHYSIRRRRALRYPSIRHRVIRHHSIIHHFIRRRFHVYSPKLPYRSFGVRKKFSILFFNLLIYFNCIDFDFVNVAYLPKRFRKYLKLFFAKSDLKYNYMSSLHYFLNMDLSAFSMLFLFFNLDNLFRFLFVYFTIRKTISTYKRCKNYRMRHNKFCQIFRRVTNLLRFRMFFFGYHYWDISIILINISSVLNVFNAYLNKLERIALSSKFKFKRLFFFILCMFNYLIRMFGYYRRVRHLLFGGIKKSVGFGYHNSVYNKFFIYNWYSGQLKYLVYSKYNFKYLKLNNLYIYSQNLYSFNYFNFFKKFTSFFKKNFKFLNLYLYLYLRLFCVRYHAAYKLRCFLYNKAITVVPDYFYFFIISFCSWVMNSLFYGVSNLSYRYSLFDIVFKDSYNINVFLFKFKFNLYFFLFKRLKIRFRHYIRKRYYIRLSPMFVFNTFVRQTYKRRFPVYWVSFYTFSTSVAYRTNKYNYLYMRQFLCNYILRYHFNLKMHRSDFVKYRHIRKIKTNYFFSKSFLYYDIEYNTTAFPGFIYIGDSNSYIRRLQIRFNFFMTLILRFYAHSKSLVRK